MKAVIMQTSGRVAAVLADDGCMHNISNHNYTTGQEIEMKTDSRRNAFISWGAAAAAVLCVGATGLWATMTPYYYVSLDVNPSVEYTLNRFDKVLSVTGTNDDGSELLFELKLNNKKIDKAIGETVVLIGNKGYFDGDIEGGIVISTSAKDANKAEKLANHLRNEVEKKVQTTTKPVHVEAISVNQDRLDEAHKLGITPGKLNLLMNLKDATGNSNMSYDEWLNKPVKDIMKAIKDNRIDLDDMLDDDDLDYNDDLVDDDDDKKNNKPANPNKPIKNDDDDDRYDDDDKKNSKPANPNKPIKNDDDDDRYDDDDKKNSKPANPNKPIKNDDDDDRYDDDDDDKKNSKPTNSNKPNKGDRDDDDD